MNYKFLLILSLQAPCLLFENFQTQDYDNFFENSNDYASSSSCFFCKHFLTRYNTLYNTR